MSTLIVALNPSIDAEWRVPEVRWEEKNNVQSERLWAGGKGINVARWLKYLGGRPQLLVPLGGKTGDELAGYLRAEKIPARIIRLRESTRVNVIVTTKNGRQMRFNPLGPCVSAREWSTIFREVGAQLPKANMLVLSGSLPRGLPNNTYTVLIQLAYRYGVPTLLDCDGPPFRAAAKAQPFLVKPNEHELAQWWRKPLRSERELVRAANALSRQTRGWVLVSRGGKRSVLLNESSDFQCFATPPRVKLRNTVGAGDALLAAVARQIHFGAPPVKWLEYGIKIGSFATQRAAGQLV